MLFNPSDHEGGLCGFVHSALILRKERGGVNVLANNLHCVHCGGSLAGWDRRESAFSF